MSTDSAIRDLLARSLGWSEAHVSLEDALREMPEDLRGVRPDGLPHSAWELLEHIRIVQRDILDFSLPGRYDELEWPAEYWPKSPEPPGAEAWGQSIATVREDRARLQELARDPKIGLADITPHGTDQTYLREILLVVDHTAYHLGQLILVRKLLGAWPAD
ncbi:DinB family protein [Singulisphaera sp. PoT]|uniref:DinB family protein n=1 Tax=Singulisphaera sp. PoT TaxID=3411797 RepID=UPI003BF4701D